MMNLTRSFSTRNTKPKKKKKSDSVSDLHFLNNRETFHSSDIWGIAHNYEIDISRNKRHIRHYGFGIFHREKEREGADAARIHAAQ